MKLSRLLAWIAAIFGSVYTLARWFALIFLLAGSLYAQHSVSLFWTDTQNPAGTTYNVYRMTNICPLTQPTNTAGFTKLTATPVSSMSFVDASVLPSTTYCYVVTSVSGTSSESAPSNTQVAAVPGSFPPVLSPPLVR